MRIQYLDSIKGFAILLVVMGHVLDAIGLNPLESGSEPKNLLWRMIMSFHMPLFFMVSGFLGEKVMQSWSDFANFCVQKAKRLLLPFVVTLVVMSLFYGRLCHYWFLLSLFQLSIFWMVLSTILRKINGANRLSVDVVFVFAVFLIIRISHIFDYGVCFKIDFLKFIQYCYFLPYAVGALMFKHREILSYVGKSSIFTISLLVWIVLFSLDNIGVPLVGKLDFVASVAMCFAVFHVFMKGIHPKLEKCFSYLGRQSLPIYILHFVFNVKVLAVGSFFVSSFTSTMDLFTMEFLYSFTVSVIIIILSLLLYRILAYSAIIRFLFFGEKRGSQG